jgi:hypothetical protein
MTLQSELRSKVGASFAEVGGRMGGGGRHFDNEAEDAATCGMATEAVFDGAVHK